MKQKKNKKLVPMFKTASLMAQYSGIGESYLRMLMDTRQIEYVQIGSKRLISDEAMWDWYQRNKITAITGGSEYGDYTQTSKK